MNHPGSLSATWIGISVFVAALTVRVVILFIWPDMYWHDGFHRLAYADELVQGGTWLPLYQGTLALLSTLTREPFWFRFLTSVYGSWAAAAGALFALGLYGRFGAWFAGLFLILCPLFLFESSGLFQEPLLNALLLTAACCLQRGGKPAVLAALCCLFLAACTRYEAWLVNGVACCWLLFHPRAAAHWHRRLLAIAWLALPELAWIVWNHGLSPMGAQSLSPSLSPLRFLEYAIIWGKLLFQWIGLLPLLMMLFGFYSFCKALWRQRPSLLSFDGEYAWLLIFSAILLLNFLLLAIAHPFYPTDNARGANLLVLLSLFFILHGLTRARPRVRQWVSLALLIGLFLSSSHPISLLRILDRSSHDFLAGLSVEVHQILAEEVSKIDHLLVVGEGFQAWPRIRTNETLSTIVGLRVHHHKVIGDYCLEANPAGKPTIEEWLTQEGVSHVLITKGWEPWRAIHDWALSEANSGGSLELLAEGRFFRFFKRRKPAEEVGEQGVQPP